jgi:hypothetical protein
MTSSALRVRVSIYDQFIVGVARPCGGWSKGCAIAYVEDDEKCVPLFDLLVAAGKGQQETDHAFGGAALARGQHEVARSRKFPRQRHDGADPVRFPFLDLYSAVMDLPAEVFLDIMRHVYQERTLVRGTLHAQNQTIALRAIRATALMTVEGEHDDIAAPGQTQRAHDLCPSVPADARRQLVVPACGHFSLFHGEIWRTRVLPEVRAFIDRFGHSGSRVMH